MYAVSTNEIADILHFSDKTSINIGGDFESCFCVAVCGFYISPDLLGKFYGYNNIPPLIQIQTSF